MKRIFIVSALLLVFVLSSCGGATNENIDLSAGVTPPDVNFEIDGESYETVLGSYCWEPKKGVSECADTAGPVELLKDKEPVKVESGEQITLSMDYTPKPNENHLSYMIDDDEIEVEIDHSQFIVPDEKGVYFFAYSVWWMDEVKENVSHASAFYAFAIEVQ